ncbi:MAG TPA: alpha-glucosidase [Novosphingobium sp.]|nr:alpha-glucosidase [Novosphingobium sp.]
MADAQTNASAPDCSASQWWRGATIYQIYPRSFADSNGDGVGDLAGITARLDHVAGLGVDAIWISPFFTSPMADFGYDVADYCDVDPVFGTLDDFDALVARAHALGLKVTIDMVFAHTSDKHPWFTQSRADADNAQADWFVWKDPNPDGTPPNNWQSVFGGPAWTWDARRCQYYYHQFLKEQPQLNVHNVEVQDALLDALRFWLDRGVDGFRLDALNHAMFDPAFTDNPPATDDAPRTRPFDYQRKIHSQNHPGVVQFIERIRTTCDDYGAIFTVAEVGGPDVVPLMKAYTAGETHLSSAYSFEFLYARELTPPLVKHTLGQWSHDAAGPALHEGWPSWAFENHDAPRHISRWAAEADRPAFARMSIALLAALRGNVFLYQGQELGLEQDDIPFHLLQDPEAIANWPLTLSRDGVRTPIPWDSALPQAGFTTGEPWLPLSPANVARAVAGQAANPASQLSHTAAVLALRRAQPALRLGAMVAVHTRASVLSFDRVLGDEVIHCAFNLGAQPHAHAAGAGDVLMAVNGASATHLPAFGALFIKR